ncbi:MAG: 50S ribosomal protein L15 [Gammaproteobacteria bacterium]|nr:50S ribosomal protein L15 [Gammaproteobacteria bacterium]
MYLNSIKPQEGSKKEGKRVGRGIGSGLGKTCGRGHKGVTSRSGGRVRRGFEGGQQPLHRRLPKVGFSSRVERITDEVRLNELSKVDGDTIDLAALKKAGVLNNSILRAKIILSGKIEKAVTVRGLGVTPGAKAAIEAAGGKVEG